MFYLKYVCPYRMNINYAMIQLKNICGMILCTETAKKLP